MPAAKVFIDTNTLLYLHDRDGGEKSAQALRWLHVLTDKRIACINMQVLHELTSVMLRKRWFSSPYRRSRPLTGLLPLETGPSTVRPPLPRELSIFDTASLGGTVSSSPPLSILAAPTSSPGT